MSAVHGLVGPFENLSIAKKLGFSFSLLAVGRVVVLIVGSISPLRAIPEAKPFSSRAGRA